MKKEKMLIVSEDGVYEIDENCEKSMHLMKKRLCDLTNEEEPKEVTKKESE